MIRFISYIVIYCHICRFRSGPAIGNSWRPWRAARARPSRSRSCGSDVRQRVPLGRWAFRGCRSWNRTSNKSLLGNGLLKWLRWLGPSMAGAHELVRHEPSKRGRKRKAWEVCEVVQLPEHGTLRKAGQEWLALKKLCHKPLSTSSWSGKVTYIAKCDGCVLQ